ncbi:NACHT domain-containing protein [Streptomyces xanthophaeus]|uniref:NACHT domain-containing protein n=1 Tax=Streptomyces xanthophaeus TaxID=67385 RepID=UPI0026492738|nr:NACHT domain-containing protein [Streptomyces xanthophaeus]WKD35312.1 NACHT domain-containing protein [Streptomyces xanthophaeus]
MTGLETVLLRVAGTAAGTLVKSLLARAPGAGLVADPARPAPRWRKPRAELGDGEMRRLTRALAERLGPEAAVLPEHERLAALDAVGDAFAALGPLDAESLFAADLDPAALAAALPGPPAGLGPAADALYARLIRLCCAHAVEYVTTLPGFGARAEVELVRRTGELARSLDRLQEGADGSAYAFEERYAQYIARAHGRLQLFGLTLSRSRQEWPLDVAYISLAVSGEQPLLPGEPEIHRTQVRAEQALASADRILLRGPAGSGKSTLVQWLALNAARQTDGPWSTCVPFVLRLRSFTASGDLPLPEDFLRAGGVPLSAPSGWVEDLMLSGRALVLVDGVDEVPQRLRTRTETWLRSLISAFPQARYVVTTRPSAVPEDWLAGLGFATHTMLPMDRRDIRAFVEHWHAAARAQGQEVDAYEASLLEAVSSRRDLARLATNPLMCALLCALNQDRRMQLPRARKELYDAALDMLLVRRDTEREICGVEGVYLTREEQVALLQRFAYWLIRNGQLEAGRDEAVEMVGAWLEAMPQVRAQGGAEQVFAHLLIRSGLLLEPTPGAVVFVHRTFQDYLGAKAAVESRDFGVLVKNAHDDSWDDVVRMAVGHARPDERARLLRGLLRRADKVKGARSRLVLLAAACLEHAPELDPEVRREIESRTAELLPPQRISQAEELARAGELVLDLLPGPHDLSEAEAAAVVHTASGVGGPQALAVVARFRADARETVRSQLAAGWQSFDRAEYVDAVLTEADLSSTYLTVETSEELAQLDRLPGVRWLTLRGGLGIPGAVTRRPGLEGLSLQEDGLLTDLSPLSPLDKLGLLSLYDCPGVQSLGPLSGMALRSLVLNRVRAGLPLRPLASMDSLTQLTVAFDTGLPDLAQLPAPDSLRSLGLLEGTSTMHLDGLDRWPDLETLALHGDQLASRLAAQPSVPAFDNLQLLNSAVDPAELVRHEQLTRLFMFRCTLSAGLEPLLALPHLTRLVVSFSAGPVDLSPLAAREDLVVEVYGPNTLLGTELFPPERLRYMS